MTVDFDDRPAAPRLKPTGPVIRAQETEIWSDAAAAIAGAERYTARTKTWARANRDRERARGFDEGRQAGAEEAARLVAATAARAELYLQELERNLPELVLELVHRILGSFDPGEVLSRAVVEAIGKLRTGSDIRIHVSPDQADALRAALAETCRTHGAPTVRVHADSGLAAGRCVLLSEIGNVELGIDAQVRALQDGIQSAWHDAPAVGLAPADPQGSP